MDRRDNSWTTYISELQLPGDDGYSLEIGYVQQGSPELYLRLWRGEEFICGAWHTDFKNRTDHHIEKLSESLTQKCVEVADRLSRLVAFI